MKSVIILLILTFLPVLVFADDATQFTGVFTDKADVKTSASLPVIQKLFTDRLTAMQTSFGGLQDVLTTVTSNSGGSSGSPPVIVFGETATFGALSMDFASIPSQVFTVLGSIFLVMSTWVAFLIVLRP